MRRMEREEEAEREERQIWPSSTRRRSSPPSSVSRRSRQRADARRQIAGHAVCALNAAEVVNIVARAVSAAEPGQVVDGCQLWIEAGLRSYLSTGRAPIGPRSCDPIHYHRTRAPSRCADCGSDRAWPSSSVTELVTSDPAMIRVARAEGIAVLPVPDSSGRTPK